MEKLSSKTQSWLLWFLRGLLVLGFLVLLGRLFELQVIKGEYFNELANTNRVRRVPITSARGDILARGGEKIASSIEIKKAVEFSPEKGYTKIDDLSGASPDGIITEWERNYPRGADFAHLTGYLGEVNENEVGRVNPECVEKGPWSIGALIGRTGLEEYYECTLSGIDGEELIEVDSQGKRIRSLGKRDPVKGDDLQTTIDFGLQKKVAEVMGDAKGAAIITDGRGEVLALYSSPSYDANLLLNPNENNRVINSLLKSSDLPFFNRVTAGSFPPGSVYKPLIALASLEEGEIDESYTYEDTGQIVLNTDYGTFTYSNWYFTQYGGVEGEINLVRAIARSTDTFFYKLGESLGVDEIVSWSEKFGLGKLTGIDLPGEVPGLVPSPKWKRKEKGEKWFLGNTYHLSIGQGDLGLTPLQINLLTSIIASKGKMCQPHLFGKKNCKDLKLETENLEIVIEGMKGACQEGGTGYSFFDFPSTNSDQAQVACKTGTAETFDEEDPHAWFTVFGPINFPEIVITVLIENGGEGSKVAAPKAREIMDYWFEKN